MYLLLKSGLLLYGIGSGVLREAIFASIASFKSFAVAAAALSILLVSPKSVLVSFNKLAMLASRASALAFIDSNLSIILLLTLSG